MFFFYSFYEGFHVVDILSDEGGVKFAARLTHALPDEFVLRLVVTVLCPVQEVWELVEDIEDGNRVGHALAETDVLYDILWGSTLFEDDFCDLLSNLGVDNVVLNQVEDMEDVFNLCLFVFNRVLKLLSSRLCRGASRRM